jgi:hypothetical protein
LQPRRIYPLCQGLLPLYFAKFISVLMWYLAYFWVVQGKKDSFSDGKLVNSCKSFVFKF